MHVASCSAVEERPNKCHDVTHFDLISSHWLKSFCGVPICKASTCAFEGNGFYCHFDGDQRLPLPQHILKDSVGAVTRGLRGSKKDQHREMGRQVGQDWLHRGGIDRLDLSQKAWGYPKKGLKKCKEPYLLADIQRHLHAHVCLCISVTNEWWIPFRLHGFNRYWAAGHFTKTSLTHALATMLLSCVHSGPFGQFQGNHLGALEPVKLPSLLGNRLFGVFCGKCVSQKVGLHIHVRLQRQRGFESLNSPTTQRPCRCVPRVTSVESPELRICKSPEVTFSCTVASECFHQLSHKLSGYNQCVGSQVERSHLTRRDPRRAGCNWPCYGERIEYHRVVRLWSLVHCRCWPHCMSFSAATLVWIMRCTHIGAHGLQTHIPKIKHMGELRYPTWGHT